jgi:hypothetical protein
VGFNYTNDNLLADIKRRTFMPISQITFTDDDLLDFADEEIQTGIVPLLMSVREDYLVTFKEDTIAINKNSYGMHPRAIGQKLSDVTVVFSNSDPTTPNETSIPRIQSDQAVSGLVNGYPGFYLRNNKVILQNPGTFSGQKLRQYYFLRPSKLVPTNQACQISRVGPNSLGNPLLANQVEVNFIPSDFGTNLTFTQTVDLNRNVPGFEILNMDIQAQFNVNTLVVTFPSLTSFPEDLEVGDWICLAGQATIPQVPVELHPILAQRVAIKVLEAMGDVSNLQLAQGKLKEAEKSVLGLLSNRVEGEPQKIVNPYSTLRIFPWRRF